MPRDDARYDYGLRGRSSGPGRGGPRRGIPGEPLERRSMPRAPRVTARYNRDYVFGGRGEEAYPRNHVPYGGERPDQIVDSSRYRYPYLSIGGTRTFRGSPEPVRYDEIYDRYYDVDYRRFR